jgi:DNA (cytosine-5)-methyltransferase 1
VVSAVEAKKCSFLVVENVPEFRRWKLYPQWRACLETLGYALTENVLDAADLGVPQHRKRLFLVGIHQSAGGPLTIPPGDAPHVPASTILEPDSECSWSPVLRAGRAGATLQRIECGRRQHGERFLLAYFGKERGGRPLSRPLGAVLTRDRYALVHGDRMRMLTAREYLRAQGFPSSYRVPCLHRLAVFLTGNATAPPVMKWVCEHIKRHLWN